MLSFSYKPQADFQRFLLDAKFAVLGQARPRKEALSKLMDISFELGHHLSYIFCAPEAREVNHWIKETSAFLSKAADLTNVKSGRLPLSDFLEYLFEGPAGEPSDRESLMIQVRHHLKPHEVIRTVNDPRFALVYVELLKEVYTQRRSAPDLVRKVLVNEGWIL